MFVGSMQQSVSVPYASGAGVVSVAMAPSTCAPRATAGALSAFLIYCWSACSLSETYIQALHAMLERMQWFQNCLIALDCGD